MNTEPEYRVEFGRTARTIIYTDSRDRLIFEFDANSSTTPQTVFLFKPGHTADSDVRNWSELALERVRQYLIGCGYTVKLS